MKRALVIALGGLAIVGLSASTSRAQVKPPHLRGNGPTAAPDGKWSVMVELNVANDTPIVTAALRADAAVRGWLQTAIPTLVVRCRVPPSRDETVLLSNRGLPVQPGLDVYFDTGMPASVEHSAGAHIISVRFDDGPAEKWGTVESTDTEALFVAPFYARQMIGRLTHSRRLEVQITPLNAPPATVSFDTRGFKTHAARVLAACPMVDRPKGRLSIGLEPPGMPIEPLIGRSTEALRPGLAALKVGHRHKRLAVKLRAARTRHVGRRTAKRA